VEGAETTPAPAAVAETHGSVVLFLGRRAYKFLKPVRTPFFDYSTPERRRVACEREVALNRRLAPDCYLGVTPILEGDEVCDHAVVMRRLPDDRRLSALLAGADAHELLRRVARTVGSFHAGLAPDPEAARVATRDAVADLWTRGNLDDLDRHATAVLDAADLAEVRRRALRYLRGRAPLFDRRVAEGRAVDGHGDLLADDIFCLDDGVRILDCLAFDDDLRRGDQLADIAFLAMDVERLAGEVAADVLLSGWTEVTGDHPPRSLLHHWVAYRALVRAKVRALRATQGDDATCRAAGEEARALLAQCLDHLAGAEVRLVLVGGAPGTGKTTTARRIGEELGAVVLSSDEVRKELAGVDRDDHVDEPLDTGRYAPAATERTYGELLRRAGELLALGESVVLDATWADAGRRDAARRVAGQAVATVWERRCVVAPDEAAARIERRRAAGGDASDVSAELSRTLAARFDPWPEATEVDTSG
jgi:aminoglycoside phosphotransferase family enzyme/predicted kinase